MINPAVGKHQAALLQANCFRVDLALGDVSAGYNATRFLYRLLAILAKCWHTSLQVDADYGFAEVV